MIDWISLLVGIAIGMTGVLDWIVWLMWRRGFFNSARKSNK